MTRTIFVMAIAAMLLPNTAIAAQTSLQIELNAARDFERHVMTYDCATETPVTVTYINAAPNFLALVPVAEEPEELVFASVVAGSGVRYVSGKWAWWTRGSDASLYDTTLGENADAVLTCSEFINTP
jgi:membrane-bound inhibitor of C-type lysozyme